MSKAIALTRSKVLDHQLDLVRGVIVLACGAALILAGQPLPL